MSEEKWVCTACPGWGDHEFCAIKTVVKDGKIVRTEAVDYTGAEAGEGHCCQKGIASWRQVYAEDRLLYPLKRAGERTEELAALAAKYDLKAALNKKPGDFTALIRETKELLNR